MIRDGEIRRSTNKELEEEFQRGNIRKPIKSQKLQWEAHIMRKHLQGMVRKMTDNR